MFEEIEFDGGSTCSETTCSFAGGYFWPDAFVGPTTVTELTLPTGYRFGWATLQSSLEGGEAPAASVDIGDRSISFDTTGFGDSDGFLVTLFDFVDVAGGPAPTLPPTSALAPTISPAVGPEVPVSVAAGIVAIAMLVLAFAPHRLRR